MAVECYQTSLKDNTEMQLTSTCNIQMTGNSFTEFQVPQNTQSPLSTRLSGRVLVLRKLFHCTG